MSTAEGASRRTVIDLAAIVDEYVLIKYESAASGKRWLSRERRVHQLPVLFCGWAPTGWCTGHVADDDVSNILVPVNTAFRENAGFSPVNGDLKDMPRLKARSLAAFLVKTQVTIINIPVRKKRVCYRLISKIEPRRLRCAT